MNPPLKASAFTQLVLPTATGPHRDLASVRLRPMPSAADSSIRPAPVCPSSALHTTATAPLPTPSASATLRPTPGTLQSWPRATQAGPESSPPDSSPPATDADLARGPPTRPTTPRGPHRELTVWDTTATAGGASGPPMPSATTATPPSTPGGPLPSLTSRGPPRDSASARPRRRLPPPRPWPPTPMAPPRSSERLSGDSQPPRLLRSVRPSQPSATATGRPRALTPTAGPQPTTGEKDLLLPSLQYLPLLPHCLSAHGGSPHFAGT